MTSDATTAAPGTPPRAAARKSWLISGLLGLVLLTFFADSFVRDEREQALAAVLVIVGFLIAGLVVISDAATPRRPRVTDVALTVLGAVAVWLLVSWLPVSSTFAACTVGVIAGLFPLVTHRVSAAQTIPLYVGAFAGMTSPLIVIGPLWLVIAALATGVIWSTVRDAWVGVGGKMGVVAFTGGLIALQVAKMVGAESQLGEIPAYAPAYALVVVLAGVAAALLTHWLAFNRRWGAVLASAATTLVFMVLLVGIDQTIDLPNDAVAAAWFGGTFVGMTAPTRLRRRPWMLPLMGLVFGILLLLFEAHLAGLGGDLGATAAAAVISVLGLEAVTRRLRR